MKRATSDLLVPRASWPIPLAALCVGALTGCSPSGPAPAETSPEPSSSTSGDDAERAEQPADRDGGARFWASSYAAREGSIVSRRSVLEVRAGDHRGDGRPASPAECDVATRGWTVRFHLDDSLTGQGRFNASADCEWHVDDLSGWSGFVSCDHYGSFEQTGVRRGIELREDGDELAIVFVGPWPVRDVTELSLARTSATHVAFEVFDPARGNSSPETGWMGREIGPDARPRAQVDLAEVERAVREEGFDPHTLPLDVAIRLREAFSDFRLVLMHFPPAQRPAAAAELTRERVADALAELTEPAGRVADVSPESVHATFRVESWTLVGNEGRYTKSRVDGRFHTREVARHEEAFPPLERCVDGHVELAMPEGPSVAAGYVLVSDRDAWHPSRDADGPYVYSPQGAPLDPEEHHIRWCGSTVVAVGGFPPFRMREPHVRAPAEGDAVPSGQALRVEWVPAGAAYTTILVSSEGHQVWCRVEDDGAFEVAAELLAPLRRANRSAFVWLQHWDVIDARLPAGGEARLYVESRESVDITLPE